MLWGCPVWEGVVFLKVSCSSWPAAAHISGISLRRVIKAAATAYGRAGSRGKGCERMPNQLKPKKLDLPHLHPCSHLLRTALQGRIGKARQQGNAAASRHGHVCGACAHACARSRAQPPRGSGTATSAGPAAPGRAQQEQRGRATPKPPSPSGTASPTSWGAVLAGQTGGKHPPRPVRSSGCSLLLLPRRFPEWLEGAGFAGRKLKPHVTSRASPGAGQPAPRELELRARGRLAEEPGNSPTPRART